MVLKIQASQEIEEPQNQKKKRKKEKGREGESKGKMGNVKVGIFHLVFANTLLCFALLSLVGGGSWLAMAGVYTLKWGLLYLLPFLF